MSLRKRGEGMAVFFVLSYCTSDCLTDTTEDLHCLWPDKNSTRVARAGLFKLQDFQNFFRLLFYLILLSTRLKGPILMSTHWPAQTALRQFGIFLTLKFPVPVCVAFCEQCTAHSWESYKHCAENRCARTMSVPDTSWLCSTTSN